MMRGSLFSFAPVRPLAPCLRPGHSGAVRIAALLALSPMLSAAELTLEIVPRWKGKALAVPSAELANSTGQGLRITRLSALISNAGLLRPDASVVSLGGQYGLIDAEGGHLAVDLEN